MQFKEGQYLEFENSVAKLTTIKGQVATLRKVTTGNTWDYQQKVTLAHLCKLHREGKLHFINYLTILKMLSNEKEEGDLWNEKTNKL